MTHSRDLFRIVSEQGVVNYGNLPKSATSTVIVIGAPKSGKSTLINSFLDQEDETKPSLPVEYTYVRRTNRNMLKDVCHVWESCSSRSWHLLAEMDPSPTVLIVADLSSSDFDNVFCIINHARQNLKAADARFALLGTKYDLIEDSDSAVREATCCTMRHLAQKIDSHLIFCSRHDRATIKVVKDLFSHLAFNTKFSYQLQSDKDRPLIIPRRSDNTPMLHEQEMTPANMNQTNFIDPADDAGYQDQAVDARRRGTAPTVVHETDF